MQLSSYVPALLGKGIEQLLANLLSKAGVKREEIDLFGIHPGGKRIIEVIEKRLNIERAENHFAFEILKDYGNMSSATVLFVLQLILKEYNHTQDPKKVLALAFGPGLTLESGLLEIIPATGEYARL
jgi:predicted naringenin-chalcone synthase